MSLVEKVMKQRNISLEVMDDTHVQEITGGGLAFKVGDLNYIALSPTMPADKKRFVEAHELGHILLGHLDQEQKVTDREQLQADLFAVVLTALEAAKGMTE